LITNKTIAQAVALWFTEGMTTKRILHGCRMAYGDQTNIWTFTVYESNGSWPQHSTIMSGTDIGVPGSFAGRLGTRRLPEWIDAIPYSDRRVKVVGRYHRAQYRAAYKLILAHLPQLFRSYRILGASMGDVSIDVYAPRNTKNSVNMPLNAVDRNAPVYVDPDGNPHYA
jgi:hypothetical protein